MADIEKTIAQTEAIEAQTIQLAKESNGLRKSNILDPR